MSNLNTNYTLWYHNPNNSNWTEDSYHQILSFETLEEFWVLDNLIEKNLIENGMFFIMKEDIVPIWENEKNEKGGYISWRIPRDTTYEHWIDLIGHILINDLFSFNPDNDKVNFNEYINGCSISPKKKFNILKIWLNQPINIEDDNIVYNDTFKLKDESSTFKLHQYNIEKDKKNNPNRK